MRLHGVYRMSEDEVIEFHEEGNATSDKLYELPRSTEGNTVSNNHPSDFHCLMFLHVLSG